MTTPNPVSQHRRAEPVPQWCKAMDLLMQLESACRDTLKSHPETKCCSVTRKRCDEAREFLARHAPKSQPQQGVQDGEYDGEIPDYGTREYEIFNAGISFAIGKLKDILGVESYSTSGGGTETLEGDTASELHDLLVAAGVIDKESNAVARHATQPAVPEIPPAGEAATTESAQKLCPDCGGYMDENDECPGFRGEPVHRPKAITAKQEASGVETIETFYGWSSLSNPLCVTAADHDRVVRDKDAELKTAHELIDTRWQQIKERDATIAELRAEVERHKARRKELNTLYAKYLREVNRVWKALGIETYVELNAMPIQDRVTAIRTRAEAAEAKCAELEKRCAEVQNERERADRVTHVVLSSLKWTGDGYEWTGGRYDYRMNPSEAVAATMNEFNRLTAQLAAANERLRAVEGERDKYRNALEAIKSDFKCTIDQYENNGPQWTNRETGSEYYDASFVIEKSEELVANITAALSQTGKGGE